MIIHKAAAFRGTLLARVPRRWDGEYLKFKGYENEAMRNLKIPGVTMVRNGKDAEAALKVLHAMKHR